MATKSVSLFFINFERTLFLKMGLFRNVTTIKSMDLFTSKLTCDNHNITQTNMYITISRTALHPSLINKIIKLVEQKKLIIIWVSMRMTLEKKLIADCNIVIFNSRPLCLILFPLNYLQFKKRERNFKKIVDT